ncbi:hypothetical protein M407DRAFT_243111, partial [Tulasnella calospora MUT 4182]
MGHQFAYEWAHAIFPEALVCPPATIKYRVGRSPKAFTRRRASGILFGCVKKNNQRGD